MKTRTVLVVLLLAVSVFAGAPQRNKKHKNDPKSLKHHLSSIKKQKNDIRKQLNNTRHQVRAVRGDIREIDGRMENLESELETTKSRLVDSRAEQRQLAKSLAQTTVQLNESKERARMRLRDMYMHGNRTVVAAFVGSTSFSDFLSRKFINKRISDKDRQVFDEYDRLCDEFKERKDRADKLVVRVAGLVSDQKRQHADLEDTRDEKGEHLSRLRNKQSDLEKLIRELDEEENSIEAQIAAYNMGKGKSSGLAPFSGRFIKPASGSLTSGYGRRFHPILKRWRMHTGVDIGAPRGSTIRAGADGIVISAGYRRGYGNTVILDHGGRLSTLYGHCSRLFVSSGQRVRRGQKIAAVGSTGLSTGPHLHFEVRVNGKPVNPMGRF